MEDPKPTEAVVEAAAEVATAAVQAAAVVTEQSKPKRKRAPRKPAAPVEAAPKKERKPRMVHEVVQDGKFIFLRGTDVMLKRMTPKQRAAFGIKDIDGKMGVPCTEQVKLTFKSPKAAADFFALSFMDETGEDEWIDAGSKADWLSEDIANLMG